MAQLWLFWVAPLIGGALGATLYAGVFEEHITVAESPAANKRRAAA